MQVPGEAAESQPNRLLLAMQDMDERKRARLAGLASAAVSLALIAIIVVRFQSFAFERIEAMVPGNPAFWLLFTCYYLAVPFSEWIIYRRLWNLPASGVGALLRKLVSNELLLGYLGEAQFYSWARGRMQMATAPFGAIKDVTILSALMGNAVTMVMLIPAWPLVSSGQIGLELRTAFLSLSVVLVTSFVILLFRRRLFTLPRPVLNMIALTHCCRIVAMLLLAALMWHMVLPAVAMQMWLVLAALRMLISRLPLIPNKDVVFAGLTVVLLDHQAPVGELMAMMAGLLLLTHLCIGAIFGAVDLAERWKGA